MKRTKMLKQHFRGKTERKSAGKLSADAKPVLPSVNGALTSPLLLWADREDVEGNIQGMVKTQRQ